ncbi:MAG: polysaccharide lyase [Planctomycetota bacterium]|nr:polysaccharide lyase [Planctomycetaceae bacterium]MDQ3330351.1 polysaccharide lyase [Planctomycetota bacterium]
MSRLSSLLVVCLTFCEAATVVAAEPPTRDEVTAALRKATTFQHNQASRHGGYVYASNADLTLREGEGTTDDDTIWVQPPGTPTVGEAFLDAYDAAGDDVHLEAAKAAGRALLLGQRQSGGWYYSISFAPEERKKSLYRLDLEGRPAKDAVPRKDREINGGWDAWKRRKYEGNQTILDDDVTQAATRFLVRLDKTLGFEDEDVHAAAELALKSLLTAQYPNGGWSASWDRLQSSPPSEDDYPVVNASYPQTWRKTWPKDFTGCYVTNDELMSRMIDTLLRAHEVYHDERYLDAAKRAGEFLLLAQMPAPQPAWAQQYDRNMQPVWSRAFEPPSISGRESQEIVASLIRLADATGKVNYLEPIPRAIAYLKASRLPDGRACPLL